MDATHVQWPHKNTSVTTRRPFRTSFERRASRNFRDRQYAIIHDKPQAVRDACLKAAYFSASATPWEATSEPKLPRSLLVSRENVVLRRHGRMARISAFGVGPFRRERVGCGIIIEVAVGPPVSIR